MKLTKLMIILGLIGSFQAHAILEDWHGFWQGECQYQQSLGGDIELIPFEINIYPIDSNEVSWNMHYYRDSGDIIKNYSVRGIDTAIGHYVTDENNGILIDEYLMQGNQLVANFEVDKRHITTVSEVYGDSLSYTAYGFGTDLERRTRAQGTTVKAYGKPALEACHLVR